MTGRAFLFGCAFLIAGRLFHATFKLAQGVTQSQDAVASLDSALAVLRADVSSARTIDITSPQTLTLTLDGDRRIVWTVTGASAARSEGDRAHRWAFPSGATFIADGPAVVLTIPKSKTTDGGEIRITNQLKLLTDLTK